MESLAATNLTKDLTRGAHSIARISVYLKGCIRLNFYAFPNWCMEKSTEGEPLLLQTHARTKPMKPGKGISPSQ